MNLGQAIIFNILLEPKVPLMEAHWFASATIRV